MLPIRGFEDPVLRRKTKRVTSLDGSIQKLIDDMVETMHHVSGVGLAAPQVGVSLRLAVIQVPEQEAVILVNPEMVRRSGERLVVEGCLSLPGYQGEIRRSEKVVVKCLDRNGKPVRIRGEDLLAQVLEHELDHLNGVLYIDHLESPGKVRPIEPGGKVAPQALGEGPRSG